MGCYDLNEADCLGSTELLLAALEGREEVVKILLGRKEVKPDEPAEHRSCMPLRVDMKGL